MPELTDKPLEKDSHAMAMDQRLSQASSRKSMMQMRQVIDDINHADHASVEAVLLHLALCHSIILDKRTGKMNSASPDELALVEGSKELNYSFEGRDPSGLITIVRKNDGKEFKYELLNTLEFNSTRKRMSVILRGPEDRIILLCKGADSIIKERLDMADADNASYLERTLEHVDAYATEGLRTLLLA